MLRAEQLVVLVLTARRLHHLGFDRVGLNLVAEPQAQEVHLREGRQIPKPTLLLLPSDRLREHKDCGAVPARRMSVVQFHDLGERCLDHLLLSTVCFPPQKCFLDGLALSKSLHASHGYEAGPEQFELGLLVHSERVHFIRQ